MIDVLFDELFSYIEFLKEEHGLKISIYDLSGVLSDYTSYLLPYFIHDCSYCLFIKSDAMRWKKCVKMKKKLTAKLKDEILFGKCYAGVYEYTIPLRIDGQLMLFIGIGSYRLQGTKKIYLAEKYKDKYMELRSDIPPLSKIKKLTDIMLRYFKMIYAELLKEKSPTRSGLSEKDYVYSHILAYLNENCREAVTLDDISSFCHYSKSYISHLFKAKNGKNINEYVNSLRIAQAEEMLKKTDLSIKEIAYTVGFSDSNYFTNVFKKEKNISPKKYRAFFAGAAHTRQGNVINLREAKPSSAEEGVTQ